MQNPLQQELKKLRHNIKLAENKVKQVQTLHYENLNLSENYLATCAAQYIDFKYMLKRNGRRDTKLSLDFFKRESLNLVDLFWGVSLLYANQIANEVASISKQLSTKTYLKYLFLVNDALQKIDMYLEEDYIVRICNASIAYNDSKDYLSKQKYSRAILNKPNIHMLEVLLIEKLDSAKAKLPQALSMQQQSSFKTLRKVCMATDILYSNDNYRTFPFPHGKPGKKFYFKQDLMLSICYSSHPLLYYCESLLKRYSFDANLQTKEDKVFYAYQLLILIDRLDEIYEDLYMSNIALCDDFLTNEKSLLQILLNQKK